MEVEYPYKVQVIKADKTLREYCKVRLWSVWMARIEHRYTKHKIPRLLSYVYIKKSSSEKQETLMYPCELRFINPLIKN